MTVSLAELIRTRPPERGPLEAVWTPPVPGPIEPRQNFFDRAPRLRGQAPIRAEQGRDFFGMDLNRNPTLNRDINITINPVLTNTAPYRPPPVVDRYALVTSRSDMDWGDAPKYNEAYRKIRWPGGQKIEYIVGEMSPRYERMAPEDRPQFTKPYWMVSLRQDLATKRGGRWTHVHRQSRLRSDLVQCMKENIPFTTKTLFYNPADQWVYVNGNRTMKYDIRSGYISEFTYSGVYNKVTSLMLRMMGIKVKLVKKNLFWFGRDETQARGTLRALPIDINSLYHFSAFGVRNGFYSIDPTLAYQMRQRRDQETRNALVSDVLSGIPVEGVTITAA